MNSWCGGYCYHSLSSSTIFSINLVSQSHTTNNFIYEGLLFISLFQLSKIISRKSWVTVFYNGKSTMLVLYQNLYLYSVWISALFRSATQRSSALWRATASGLRRRSCSWPLQRLYHHICQCVNVSMCTQIRCQYHLTIQVKIGCPTDWVVSRNLGSNAAWVLSPPRTVGRDADSVASSHSTPIRVLYCLYSESGLFWAI